MKKRGSAIIIAMLLISAVGTIAFSFSRALFVEIANANIYENGTIAYYAAESGIEEGMLRFRLNRNIQLPSGTRMGDNFAIRSDLTDSQIISKDLQRGTDRNIDEGIEPAAQIFDLRMTNRAEAINVTGKDSLGKSVPNLVDYKPSTDPAGEYVIKRDESKKFDLSNIFLSSDVNFYFKPLLSEITLKAPFNERRCVLIEAKITGQDLSSTKTDERKTIFYSNFPSCDYSNVFDKKNLPGQYLRQYNISADGTVQIKNIKSILWPTVLLSSSSLSIKPIGSDIAFSIERKNPFADDLLYSPATTIESVGYYGDVVRKLEASIDRQSGTLYDLFDYVIYKAK